MHRRLLAIGIAATAVLGSTTIVSATPAAAAVAPVDRFVLEGEPGDYIKGSAHTDQVLTAGGGVDGVFDASVGGTDWWFTQLRTANNTDRFTVGLYDGAIRAAVHAPDAPGIDVFGEGRGCNTLTGRFRVDQADYDGAGNLTAFAARIEQHCEGGSAAAFASVARQATVPVYAHVLSASSLSFPATNASAPSTMPFRVTNTSTAPMPVTALDIAGTDAAAFHLTIDTCTGVTLAPGASCGAEIAFAPTTFGPASAQLLVKDAFTAWAPGAAGERVPLSGSGTSPVGTASRLILDGEPGDYIVGDQHVDVPVVSAQPLGGRLVFGTNQFGGWIVNMGAPTGTSLTPGLYEGAERFPASGTPGLDVYGDGRGCNATTARFRVDEARYAPDGTIQAFAARFEQRCEGFMPPLLGSVAWNASVPVYGHTLSAKHLDLSGTGAAALALTNTGAAPLPVHGLSLAGADAASFTIASDGCSGATLAVGASCTVSVAVQAGSTGDVAATLVVRDAFTSWTPDGGGQDVALTATVAAAIGGELHPLAPARVLDTRDGTGLAGLPHRLGDGETITFPVLGRGGVPAADVTSVVVNLTATDASTAGWLALHPSDEAWSGSSSVNFPAGGTAPNMAIVAVGADGRVALRNCCGSVDAVVDVVGWFGGADAGPALGFRGMPPVRALDTRTLGAPLGAGETLRLPLGGATVPASARAVVVNLTATGGTAPTFVTAYPGDGEMPLASSLNVAAGETRPNLVTVKLGGDGGIALTNHAGAVHLVVDVVGYYDGSHSPGGRMVSGNPVRLFDTRDTNQPLGAGGRGYLDFSDDRGCVFVEAAVMNVTATGPTAASYLTVYPDSGSVPLASSLNVVPGQTVANLVMVQVPDDGVVWFYNNSGRVHVVADLVGVVTRSSPSAPWCAGGQDPVAGGTGGAAAAPTVRPSGLVRVGF